MEDIRLYDLEGRLLHIENDVISSNWTIYYNKVGTFEGHFDINSDIVPIIMDQPFLILMQGCKQAFIVGKHCGLDFTVYGRTLNWLLSRRVTEKFASANLPAVKTIESIAFWLIGKAFDSSDHLTCKASQNQLRALNFFWSNKMQMTCDVIENLCSYDYAGHRISYDQNFCAPSYKGQFVFEIIKGRQIPHIISVSSKNAYDIEYQESLLDYYNGGWFEAEENVSTKIDTNQQGILRWMSILNGNTRADAMKDLQKKKWEKAVQTKIRGFNFSFDYSEESYNRGDYHLGDILKLQKEFGKYKITEDRRVIGVDFWYEGNNIGQQPILETDGPLPEEVQDDS